MRTSKKKKLRLKPLVVDILCIVCGLVIGSVIADLTQNIGFLKWLSYDVPFGSEQPLPLTFLIFKITIGFSIHLNPAVVLFGLLGFVLGRYFRASAALRKEEETSREDDEQ